MRATEDNPPDELSLTEWRTMLEQRKRSVFEAGRNAGLEQAAQLVESWTGYKQLAAAVSALAVKTAEAAPQMQEPRIGFQGVPPGIT